MLGDVFWIVVPVAACVGMLWLANRIEPHWAAKDGRRFLTTAQTIDRHGQTLERRREVRITVSSDGTLRVSRRAMLRRDQSQVFRVRAKTTAAPRGKEIFVLDSLPADPAGNQLVVRLPSRSPAVATLDAMIADAG